MDGVRVLVADDDAGVRETCAAILQEAGHEVDVAATEREVLDRTGAIEYDLLLQDVVFPPVDGIDLLREVKRLRPSLLVVVMTGFATVDNVIRGYRSGAFDFLLKPIDSEQLLELGQRVAEVRRMGEQRRRLARELESERHRVMKLREELTSRDPFQRIIGHSPAMTRLLESMREVARTDSTVLLTGDSGTGKGLMARLIHEASSRGEGPFVEANCVVYSEGVLHSELFGHEKGSFTGAARTKKGRFELAQGGTLFLDEIGEIAQSTQLMLLRVLQDRTFERVGGEETLEADVRLIAATNRDLREAMQRGSFRSDLYYRLNVIPVHLPRLCDHSDDVPELAQHFLERCAARLGRGVEGFSPAATGALVAYRWPGNVRELENLVERLVVLAKSRTIPLTDLPAEMSDGLEDRPLEGASGTLRSMERQKIVQALEEASGNKKDAARALGIHRSTLYAKMRRHGLLDDPRRDARHDVSDLATRTSSR